MRIAVVSDEPYPIHEAIAGWLESNGHTVRRFGSVAKREDVPYADAALEAAAAIANGRCDEGVFFCWTGTGISIAANKVPGIRAALCCDAETARDARIWNHANVLALSNRWITEARAREVIEAWLATPSNDPRGSSSVETIEAFERGERITR